MNKETDDNLEFRRSAAVKKIPENSSGRNVLDYSSIKFGVARDKNETGAKIISINEKIRPNQLPKDSVKLNSEGETNSFFNQGSKEGQSKIAWNDWKFNPSDNQKDEPEKNALPLKKDNESSIDNVEGHDALRSNFKIPKGILISEGTFSLPNTTMENNKERQVHPQVTQLTESSYMEEFKSDCSPLNNNANLREKNTGIFSEIRRPPAFGEASLLTSILNTNAIDNPSNPRPEPQSIDMIPCEFCGKEVKFSHYAQHTARHISKAARSGGQVSHHGSHRIDQQNGFTNNKTLIANQDQQREQGHRFIVNEREFPRGSSANANRDNRDHRRNMVGNRENIQEVRRAQMYPVGFSAPNQLEENFEEVRRAHVFPAGFLAPNHSDGNPHRRNNIRDPSEGRDEEAFRDEGSIIRNGNYSSQNGVRVHQENSERSGLPYEERRIISPLDLLAMLLGHSNRASASRGGLKREEIELFDKLIFNEKMQEGSCSICLMNFSQGEELRFLSCFHRFHAQCIDVWLTNKRTCPECKRDVRELMREGDQFEIAEGK